MKPMSRWVLMLIGALVALIVMVSAQKRAFQRAWIRLSQTLGAWYGNIEQSIRSIL